MLATNRVVVAPGAEDAKIGRKVANHAIRHPIVGRDRMVVATLGQGANKPGQAGRGIETVRRAPDRGACRHRVVDRIGQSHPAADRNHHIGPEGDLRGGGATTQFLGERCRCAQAFFYCFLSGRRGSI